MPRLSIAEFFVIFTNKNKEAEYESLVLEKSRGNYTEAYRQLTQEFHPHF